jgi:hypothetical protein
MENKTVYQRLAAINNEVKAIAKGQTNIQQNFKFRGIDDVMIEMHDLLAKYEVFITQKVIDQKREERPSKSGGLNIWSIVTYQFTFCTVDGSSISTEMVGEAMDSGDKGNAKCVSIALKYAILDMFSIPTKETAKIDPDHGHVELKLSLSTQDIDLINSSQNKDELIKNGHNILKRLGMKYKPVIDIEYGRRLREVGGEYVGA